MCARDEKAQLKRGKTGRLGSMQQRDEEAEPAEKKAGRLGSLGYADLFL